MEPNVVNSNGSYKFTNIPVGEYFIVAFKDIDDDNQLDFDKSTQEPIEPVGSYGPEEKIEVINDLNDLNFELENAEKGNNSISGRIDNLDGDLSNVQVWLIDSATEIANLSKENAVDIDYPTPEENNYLFENVAPGSYYIFAFSDDNNDDIPGLDLFERAPEASLDEPLGFYGGYAKAIDFSEGDSLNSKNINISTNYLATSIEKYIVSSGESIPELDSEVKLYNSNSSLITTADKLFQTSIDGEEIAFVFLTGLQRGDYYLEATNNTSSYADSISPVFGIGTGSDNSYKRYYIELFPKEFLAGVFAEVSVDSSSPYILAIVDEAPDDNYSVEGLSIKLDGLTDYLSTDSNIGYLPSSEEPPLDFTLSTFKYHESNDYNGDGEIDTLTFVTGVKNIESGEYDVILDPGGANEEIVENFVAKDGKLTFIQTDPDFLRFN